MIGTQYILAINMNIAQTTTKKGVRSDNDEAHVIHSFSFERLLVYWYQYLPSESGL